MKTIISLLIVITTLSLSACANDPYGLGDIFNAVLSAAAQEYKFTPPPIHQPYTNQPQNNNWNPTLN